MENSLPQCSAMSTAKICIKDCGWNREKCRFTYVYIKKSSITDYYQLQNISVYILCLLEYHIVSLATCYSQTQLKINCESSLHRSLYDKHSYTSSLHRSFQISHLIGCISVSNNKSTEEDSGTEVKNISGIFEVWRQGFTYTRRRSFVDTGARAVEGGGVTPLGPYTTQHVQEHLTVGPFSISAGLDTCTRGHTNTMHTKEREYVFTDWMHEWENKKAWIILVDKHSDVRKPSWHASVTWFVPIISRITIANQNIRAHQTASAGFSRE